nr:anaerobic ribonucleoside-triphosphate reductase [Butyricicoccus sp. Marseille-Q5471]
MENKEMNEMLIGEGVGFERIRRITGYLVGTLDRFNNAKRAEVSDRVKHGLSSCCSASEQHTA